MYTLDYLIVVAEGLYEQAHRATVIKSVLGDSTFVPKNDELRLSLRKAQAAMKIRDLSEGSRHAETAIRLAVSILEESHFPW